MQVGIVSWSGDSCGTEEQPDIDTKVAAFHDWVQRAMEEVEQAGGDTGYTKGADTTP